MRQIKHPVVERNLIWIVEHIVDVTQGSFDAVARRLDGIDALVCDIAANSTSGLRLIGPLDGLAGPAGRPRSSLVKARYEQENARLSPVGKLKAN